MPSSRPNVAWYIGDSEYGGIVGPNGNYIDSEWNEFEEYTCIIEDDAKELLKYILNLEGELKYGR